MRHHIAKQLLRIALQSFQLGVHFADDVRLRLDPSLHKRSQRDQVCNLHPLQTFQKNDHIAIRHFYGLVYFGHGSDLMQVRGGGSSMRGSSCATTAKSFSSPSNELTSASELSRPTVSGSTAPGNSTVSRTGRTGKTSGTENFFSAMMSPILGANQLKIGA